jgi:hypothetical protein
MRTNFVVSWRTCSLRKGRTRYSPSHDGLLSGPYSIHAYHNGSGTIHRPLNFVENRVRQTAFAFEPFFVPPLIGYRAVHGLF